MQANAIARDDGYDECQERADASAAFQHAGGNEYGVLQSDRHLCEHVDDVHRVRAGVHGPLADERARAHDAPLGGAIHRCP